MDQLHLLREEASRGIHHIGHAEADNSTAAAAAADFADYCCCRNPERRRVVYHVVAAAGQRPATTKAAVVVDNLVAVDCTAVVEDTAVADVDSADVDFGVDFVDRALVVHRKRPLRAWSTAG